MEDIFGKTPLPGFKETTCEVVIDFLMQWVQAHAVRTLIKGTVRGVEYLCHQMLLAARENEMDIGGKLHI